MNQPGANRAAGEHGVLPGLSLQRCGLRSPEQSGLDLGIALGLCVVSILALWPFTDFTPLYSDEGIILQGAERILQGQLPYRDFFTFYTPLSYYWTALRLRIFGNSFFVARAILLVYGGVFSMVIYLVARRVCSRGISILTAYMFLATGLPQAFAVLHNWDAAFWSALALYAAVLWLESGAPVAAWAAGTLTSITMLTNQSMGVGLLLGLGIACLILVWRQPDLPAVRRGHFIRLLSGVIWPWVVVALYFSSQGALTAMFADLIWPLHHYSTVNRTPYGYSSIASYAWQTLLGHGTWLNRLLYLFVTSPLVLIPAFPFAALAFLGYGVARKRRGFAAGKERRAYVVVVCTCGLGGILSAVAGGRPDIAHLIYVSIPLYVTAGWVVDGYQLDSALLVRTRPLLGAYLLVSFTAMGMVYLVSGPLSWGQRLETRRGVVRLPCCDTVIPYLMAHVSRGEEIFVYPYQPLYYFLSGTSSSTEFDYLQLGMHTDAQVKEAIATLESKQTRYIVYALAFNSFVVPQVWPSTSQHAMAEDLMRDYLLRRYRPCLALSSVALPNVFLVRRGDSCPEEITSMRGERPGV